MGQWLCCQVPEPAERPPPTAAGGPASPPLIGAGGAHAEIAVGQNAHIRLDVHHFAHAAASSCGPAAPRATRPRHLAAATPHETQRTICATCGHVHHPRESGAAPLYQSVHFACTQMAGQHLVCLCDRCTCALCSQSPPQEGLVDIRL
jgi:hypothetical protein